MAGVTSSSVGLPGEDDDYESSFDEEQDRVDDERREKRRKKERRKDLAAPGFRKASEPKASSSHFTEEVTQDEGRRQRFQLLSLSAYDRHKKLVNDYMLYFPGATSRLTRDTSRDKNDLDVIRENHRFLWDGEDVRDDAQLSWGQTLAKKYAEKLFKEYCICDLSRYSENKVAMRWRTQNEVVEGKGQFTCGARKCQEKEKLRTWEVNFAYVEEGVKKNTLVKVRLCPDCSYKLNYHHKKKEVTRKKKKEEKKKKKKRHRKDSSDSTSDDEEEKEMKEKKRKMEEEVEEKRLEKKASDIWSAPLDVEKEKSREEDFSEYLDELFL